MNSTEHPAKKRVEETASRPALAPVFIICVYLAGLVWLVFGQTLRYSFVDFDDNGYVYQNPEVAAGLSLHGVKWAFTHSDLELWTPLTTLSHMLDCQLFGLVPAGHHLTSVLLHMASVILLFLILRETTGALWRSAFVAAVFAIHPLRVESVAWIAERKDVLSGLFFMLTLAAYVRYARKPSAAACLIVLIPFALGLLSKPMLVTAPFVLLLLDYWPLDRSGAGLKRLLLEKIPFLLLSAVMCGKILLESRMAKGGHVDVLPQGRAGNAVVSTITYLGEMFYPRGLTVLYPYPPGGQPAVTILLASLVLAGISAVVILWARRLPYLAVGWLWYLGMLVPVAGVLWWGGGNASHADRYTYLPQIGVYILLTWGTFELSAQWKHRRELGSGLALLILAALVLSARAQTAYWQDSETLWNHAIAFTRDNALAHNNLGNEFLQKGLYDEAISHYGEALAIDPNYADAHNDLGIALMKKGKLDEAISHFRIALRILPDDTDARNDLASALFLKGDLDRAISEYSEAIAEQPRMASAHHNLGRALARKGLDSRALFQYQEAVEIDPRNFGFLNSLAWHLATSKDASVRDGPKALELAQEADALSGGQDPDVLRTLAAASAAAGKFAEAAKTARRALSIVSAQGGDEGPLRAEIARYDAGEGQVP